MEFPDSIEGFGYNFNEDGQLRSITAGEPYQFHFNDDHSYNQKRYEALGEVITSHIYHCLEDKCGLKRLYVPMNPSAGEPKTFIFCSENYNTADKLLILIHGSGVVRAGQWARRLIINDCIDSGTQIPFIKRGLEEGYGIIVMNTNDNTELIDGKILPIEDSDSPEMHGYYVWKNYVKKCTASHVAIVAHSYGGVILTKLADKFANEFHNRVFAVALTDSVHFRIPKNSNLVKIGRNWIGSSKPLDTPIERRGGDIECVSAGCIEHELTSWSSFESIFKFFSEMLTLSIESAKLESSSSTHKKQKVDPLILEDCEETNAEGNTSTSDLFERKDHSISPDHVDDDDDDESKRHSKENDLNEKQELMETDCQLLELSNTDVAEPLHAIKPTIDDPNPGMGPDTTNVTNAALEADGSNIADSEILDLTNSQVKGNLEEDTSSKVNEASESVNSPVTEEL